MMKTRIIQKDKKAVKKYVFAIVPVLIVGLIFFLADNWQNGFVKQTELLQDYTKTVELDQRYLSISSHNKYLSRLDSVEGKISEMHADIRTIMMGMRSTNAGFDLYVRENKKPPPKNKKPKDSYADNGEQ